MRRLLGAAALTAAAFLLGDSKPNPMPPVTGPGAAAAHRLTSFARLDGTRVIYDRGQLPLHERRR